MSTEKQYIGTGRQKDGSHYITLNLDMNEVLNASVTEHEDGRLTMKVIVAKMRRTDKYGRSHTVYVPIPEDQEDLKNQRVADLQEIEYRKRED
jgi:hypothetical protein